MKDKNTWAEICVAVSADDADAVANFLIELGSNGVVEENLQPSPALPAEKNRVVIKAYLKNGASLARSIKRFKNYLASLGTLRKNLDKQPPDLVINEVADEDWSEQWKSFFQPLKVTDRIVIKPSWRKYWKKADEIVLELDPGMAFGTGTHASTRLCLQAIEELVTYVSDMHCCSLLDVGTGSGILAIASGLLGIGEVVGIDIDHQALQCAQKNAAINQVTDRILFSSAPLQKVAGCFSIVVANILPHTLINMHHDLTQHLAPDGYLILSGILQEKSRGVINEFRQDLLFTKETIEGEWSCLIFQKSK